MGSNQTLASGSKTSLMLQETRKRNTLVDDLINEIIKHLPGKSNYRFKCVSKEWFSLNSEALKLKRPTMSGMFYATDEAKRNGVSVKYARTEEDGNEESCIDETLSFLPELPYMNIHGSCNGLLLCEGAAKPYSPHEPTFLYVCNPATRNWVEIPFHYTGAYSFTLLDFNPLVSVDFNVITIRSCNREQSQCTFEVFSSKTGEWKVSQAKDTFEACNPEYRFHYLTTSIFKGLIFCINSEKTNVAGFDTEGNCCCRIDLPGTSHPKNVDFLWDFGLEGRSLFQHGGYLNYCYVSESEGESKAYVWKLVDYESGSWLLRYSFPVVGRMRGMRDLQFHLDMEEVVFLRMGDKLHSYNMRTAQMIEFSSFYVPSCFFPYSPRYWDGFGNQVESK